MKLIKFAYVIAGPVTKGGTVFAETIKEARKMIERILIAGEKIHSLQIDRR